MGSYQWKMFFACGLGWIADNLWLQVLALVLPKVKDKFELDEVTKTFATSFTFVGMVTLQIEFYYACFNLL